jgi:CRISPR type IV-associated protein Csf3
MAIPNHPVHLDALLAYAAVSRAEAEGIAFSEAIAAQDRLPLQKWKHNGSEGYCASCLYLQEPAESPFQTSITSRPELDLFAEARRNGHKVGKNTFPVGTGAFKQFQIKIPRRSYKGATAWCIGIPEQITDLLGDLLAIGKFARNAFGRIHSVAVEPDSEAAQRWMRRNLPEGANLDPEATYFPAAAATYPPYWKREHFQGALVPADWHP